MNRHLLIALFLPALLCVSRASTAQVAITKATGGLQICTNKAVGGSAFGATTLDTLIIREMHTTDFSTGADSLVLKPPTGWKFWAGTATTLEYFGTDLSGELLEWSGDSIVLGCMGVSTSGFDTQKIIGIQVYALSDTAAPGYIYASRVMGIAGITLGPAGTDFGDLSLSPSKITGSSVVCIGGTSTLVDTSIGGTWTSFNTGIATVVPSSGVVGGVAAGTDTIYYVSLSACVVRKVISVVSCAAAVTQISRPADFVTIYPNPANDNLAIDMAEGAYQSYTITNTVGQVMIQRQLNNTNTDIDVRNLLPGMYFVSFTGAKGNITLRFLKR